MPTAIVTGANSGIGFAFTQLLIRKGYSVTAVDVNVGDKINSLGCATAQVDVSNPASIAAFKETYGFGSIDLLLNIAGVMPPHDDDALSAISHDTLAKVFGVNTFGPLLFTQALLPNLLLSKSPKLGVMSSRMGSIADNSSGGSYSYRASKAAVNSVFKSLAVDLKDKGVAVVIMHPGIVRTNMTAGMEGIEGAAGPEEVVEKLYEVLDSKGLEDTGRFWHRDGYELEW
ncbi:NAD(P)-binding protein [Annulohypoxylon maeteangense]|uniref:NAD(P)-binding protein n=1 Tax=Annulohypoxylon maeteangense TaxID=1927788 RepID=UPI002008734D|nr:NAD(P)-binding protein [Annulohypoxylon maeteangense]KAI0884742.1 NAD(P)-binding protein [Annulohypoxylon maeteangense]